MDSGPECSPETDTDVAVIGAGVAGLAAAVHLARAGRRVLCIEPAPIPQSRVGESLDWSSPGLLSGLGVPPAELIRDGIATAKRNIVIITTEKSPLFKAAPWQWFRNPPLRFEIVTVHVDRVAMDKRFCELATRHGVEILQERVVALDADGDRVCSITTQSGRRITARWFIDASGRSTRFLARKFRLARTDYGRTKVCLWRHFDTAIHNEGTTFYVDSAQDDYLSWIWEIPITPQKASVGCIMPAEYVGRQRQLGKSVQDILRERLGRFARFDELLTAQADGHLNVLSYRSYVYHRPCGTNWFIMGEAATLVDPLTANGVTAALRHAAEGAQFILESWKRGQLTRRQKAVYTANLTGMGHFFNHSIEASIYDWPVRWGLGLIRAVNIYTAFAYTVNAVYSRLKPTTPAASSAFGLLYSGIWLRVEAWAVLGRLSCGVRWLCSIGARKSARRLSARGDGACLPNTETQADPGAKMTVPIGGLKP